MYRIVTACRACGSRNLEPVFDLGVQPLANDFCTPADLHGGYAPLKLLFCPDCTLAQLSVVVQPEILYRNYKYVTSPSQTMKQHIAAIYADITSECGGRVGTVLEIGSNDGALLEQFRQLGAWKVIGFDPAYNLADIAKNQRDVKTIPKFFCEREVLMNRNKIGEMPDVILARHVFCHIDDWQDFIRAIEIISHKDTLICIEVPYALDTLKRVEFDQIYHEHLSFLTVHAMEHLLFRTKLHIHGLRSYPIHGGSMMVMLRHNDWKGEQHESFGEWFSDENVTVETWRQFANKARNAIDGLYGVCEELARRQHKTIAGMGASAKSTVWINAAQIGHWISFIADETPQKQGRFSPGSNIPILPESALIERRPDYAIVFAWNFLDDIRQKNAAYEAAGGHWIVPGPKVEMI